MWCLFGWWWRSHGGGRGARVRTGSDGAGGVLLSVAGVVRAGQAGAGRAHSRELETSVLLHAHPDLVRDGYHQADWVADDRRHLLTTGVGDYTHSGVIGRPSLASAEKGKEVLASLVENFAYVLEILRRA
jgi:creatinine amidohydrolase